MWSLLPFSRSIGLLYTILDWVYLKALSLMCFTYVTESSVSYRAHIFRLHHTTIRPAKVSSSCVNRNKVSIIDEIGTHCAACGKTYRSKLSYKSHIYRIHGIPLPKLRHRTLRINGNVIPDESDKNNYCASCNRTYIYASPG
ncbi:hypothetical protein BDF21DRAFT_409619 [Thamnidium elegans]|nr:hypothetical protein BDF21DRAFT_409619 [Thamnidium elegans]